MLDYLAASDFDDDVGVEVAGVDFDVLGAAPFLAELIGEDRHQVLGFLGLIAAA